MDSVADCGAKRVDEDLSDDEEEDTERDMPQGPAVVERVPDEEELHDNVDEEADCVQYVDYDKQSHGIRGV